MKKFLVTLLAVMMVFALATSAIAYTDDAEITKKEAVAVTSAAGLINGMPSGAFDGDANITRAQAAKIVYVLLEGEDDQAAAFMGGANFTDVPAGHWANGYIAYGVAQGVINGMGDGTFAPEANVTYAQLAKMILGAIGFDAQYEGYTGSLWQSNVMNDAKVLPTTTAVDASAEISMFAGMDTVNGAANATREDAAQMFLNALKARAQVFNVTDSGTTITAPGVEVITGRTGNYNWETTNTIAEEWFDLEFAPGEDALGRVALDWFDAEGLLIGSFGDAADYIVVIDADTAGDSTSTVISDWKKAYTDSSATAFVINGSDDTYADPATLVGYTYEFYFGDDKEADTIIAYNYVLAQITDVVDVTEDEKIDEYDRAISYEVTFDNGAVVADTFLPNFDAKTWVDDAYVTLIETAAATVVGMDNQYVTEVALADYEEIAPTAIKTNEYIAAGTTKYYMADGINTAAYDLAKDAGTVVGLYLDPNGFVVGHELVTGEVSVDEALFVAGIELTWKAAQGGNTSDATVYTVNNKGEVVSYVFEAGSDGGDVEMETATFASDAVYTVEEGDDDYVFSLFSDGDYTVAAITNSSATFNTADDIKLEGYYVTANTKYIVIEDENIGGSFDADDITVTTYTGDFSIDVNAVAGVLVANDDNEVLQAYFVVDTFKAPGADTVLFFEDATSTTATAGGFEYTAYNMAGEKLTVTIDDNNIDSSATFFTFTVDTDGIYDVTAEADTFADGEGFVTGLTYTSGGNLYKTMVTFDSTVEDLEAGDAKVIDLRSNPARKITSLKGIDEYGSGATFALYADEDGATVIFVY